MKGGMLIGLGWFYIDIIDTEYLDISSIDYYEAYASDSGYYIAEAEIYNKKFIFISVDGTHSVSFKGGSWDGYTSY